MKSGMHLPGEVEHDVLDGEALSRRAPAVRHSHNDYLRPHPLGDALSSHADSVEADVHKSNHQLLVGHIGSAP